MPVDRLETKAGARGGAMGLGGGWGLGGWGIRMMVMVMYGAFGAVETEGCFRFKTLGD